MKFTKKTLLSFVEIGQCASGVHFLTVFPIQMHRRPMLTLPKKIGHGHHRVMIYIHIVVLASSIFLAKFR